MEEGADAIPAAVIEALENNLEQLAEVTVGRVIADLEAYREVEPAALEISVRRNLGIAVRTLRAHHLDRSNAPVFVQSFETSNLRELAGEVKVPLVQLVDASGAPYDLVAKGDKRTYRDLVSPAGLRDVATYADAVGANKDLVLPRDADGSTGKPSDLVDDAHDAGLRVHVWTLRRENQFMAVDFRRGSDPNAVGDLAAEVRAFLDAGVDGMFTDNADVAVQARDRWVREGRLVA